MRADTQSAGADLPPRGARAIRGWPPSYPADEILRSTRKPSHRCAATRSVRPGDGSMACGLPTPISSRSPLRCSTASLGSVPISSIASARTSRWWRPSSSRLASTGGAVTEDGMRNNVSVARQIIGPGCAASILLRPSRRRQTYGSGSLECEILRCLKRFHRIHTTPGDLIPAGDWVKRSPEARRGRQGEGRLTDARRGSNTRPLPWQGTVLILYSRWVAIGL
jgi:hypothetical protein